MKSPTGGDYLIPDRATGDFLTWLNANTHSARYALEQYIIVSFASAADIPAALTALRADPYVASANEPLPEQFLSASLIGFSVDPGPLGGNDQYGWFDINSDAAWSLTGGGYALIGQIDMGLYENHAALRQFSGSAYAGGNFVKAASKDVGLTGQPAQSGFDSTSVDEAKPMFIGAGACTSVGALLPPAIAGHGTHTAGLLGANGAAGLGVQGTCKHCGIAEWKAAYLLCNPSTPIQVQPLLNTNAEHRAEAQVIDIGVQAISMSLGASNAGGIHTCQAYRTQPECLAIVYAAARDVPMIASSGNRREEIAFPASDSRVISAGGFNQSEAFWDDTGNCPAAPYGIECGSNFSITMSGGNYLTHQELLGSSKEALSTFYPNMTYVDYAECGDGYGTPMGDGIGWCTGTSMSAPQIAGAVGLLRSINPLVPGSMPAPTAGVPAGLRSVLAQTASRGGVWDHKQGYGIPDVAAAASKMLGKVAGGFVRNRVTPLFRLYNATSKDFADTTSPQYALSLMINQAHNYAQPASGLGAELPVPGYTFPYDTHDPNDPNDYYDSTPPATPRAAVYVLTTETRPRNEWPALIPLYLMDKPKTSGTDYMLVTNATEIQNAHTAGYNLRTIQGYIYQPCTPETTCIPPGAMKVWREYNATNSDCAIFVDIEKSTFEANGYSPTAHCPGGGTSNMIGYAYSAKNHFADTTVADADGDGLIDGFEYAVGTNPNAADSDGDGVPDGVEYPMVGLPVNDPCKGGTLGARNCGADIIFRYGFNY